MKAIPMNPDEAISNMKINEFNNTAAWMFESIDLMTVL